MAERENSLCPEQSLAGIGVNMLEFVSGLEEGVNAAALIRSTNMKLFRYLAPLIAIHSLMAELSKNLTRSILGTGYFCDACALTESFRKQHREIHSSNSTVYLCGLDVNGVWY